jgi:phosphoribosylglycinamide formyltransferase-1
MERLYLSELVKQPHFTLGFLASHNGSAMRAIIESTETGELTGMTPGVVISENDSPALHYAAGKNIPNFWVNEQTKSERDAQIFQIVTNHNVNLLICSGYMKKVPPVILTRIPTLNIHPADTEKYGGKGMYGDRVHEAVLQAGELVTLPTVHFATDKYDEGSKIAQGEVTILPTDSIADLRERVKEAESPLYIEVLKGISNGSIPLPF